MNERNTLLMKSVVTKIAALLLLALLVALVNFVGGAGTASAAPRSVHTSSHSACGWSGQNFSTGFAVTGTEWVDTCDGGVHCAVVDNGYVGSITVTIEAFNSSGGLASDLSTSGYFTAQGQYLNTDTVPRGYSQYICSVSGQATPTPPPAATPAATSAAVKWV